MERKVFHLDQPLFFFDEERKEPWTGRDAVRGTQIFGGIGSGKTSGSGKWIAHSFLKNGFGGIVLCGKPEEAVDWQKYAEDCGRGDDIILFREGSPWQFNPLHYETARQGAGAGETSNIVNMFMTIYRLGQRISGNGESKESERFWESSLRRCISRLVDLLKLSGEEVSVYNMVEVLNTAPFADTDEFAKLNNMKAPQIKKFGEKNYCIGCLYKADQNKSNSKDERDFELVFNYFFRDFAYMPERTRSTVMEMFLGLAEPFLTGLLNDHFSQGTNLVPEVTFDGKIIVLDFPVKNYLEAGIYAQCIFKLLWQQATERRKVSEDTLPVFLWVDEAQYFAGEYDMLYQTTARSSKACTVFLSQNISNYYAMIGGTHANARVDSLLGNLSTKIFHGNNDSVTNDWASRVIGQDLIAVESGGRQYSDFNLIPSKNDGYSMHTMHQVLPLEFTLLKTGGVENNYEVQAIVTLTGRRWANGKNYRKVTFSQSFS
jgi:hypothetical protein